MGSKIRYPPPFTSMRSSNVTPQCCRKLMVCVCSTHHSFPRLLSYTFIWKGHSHITLLNVSFCWLLWPSWPPWPPWPWFRTDPGVLLDPDWWSVRRLSRCKSFNATHCSAMPHSESAVKYDAPQCNITKCNATWCSIIRCNELQCNRIQHHAMLHQKILSPCLRSNPSAYQDPQGTQRTLFALCHQHFKANVFNAIQMCCPAHSAFKLWWFCALWFLSCRTVAIEGIPLTS